MPLSDAALRVRIIATACCSCMPSAAARLAKLTHFQVSFAKGGATSEEQARKSDRRFSMAKLLRMNSRFEMEEDGGANAWMEGQEATNDLYSTFIANTTDAVEWNVISLLTEMVLVGAKINHQNHNGFTPLHYACQAAWSPALVEILLDTYQAEPTLATAEARYHRRTCNSVRMRFCRFDTTAPSHLASVSSSRQHLLFPVMKSRGGLPSMFCACGRTAFRARTSKVCFAAPRFAVLAKSVRRLV